MSGPSLSGEHAGARLSRWWRRIARRRMGPLQALLTLVVAGTLAALAILVTRELASRQARVLAVLPMEIGRGDATDSTEAAVVLESLGEELVARLHAAPTFRVLPWATSGRALAKGATLQSTASEMRATHLLTGSVVSNNDEIRVRLSLVRGHDAAETWSRDVAATPGDYAGLQGQVALAVAEGMSGHVADRIRTRLAADAPRSPEAYAFFVRGASALHSPELADQSMARALFEHAIELDPTLAPAWVALGGTYLKDVFEGREGDSSLVTAQRSFERAQGLRGNLPVAERGLISLAFESVDPRQCERMLAIAARALQRDPEDVDQLITAGMGFTLGAQAPLAVPVLEHALKLDPGNQTVAWYRVLALAWGGLPTRSLAAGAAYIARFGEDSQVYTLLGGCSIALGHTDQARLYLERAAGLPGSSSWHYSKNQLTRVYALLGDSTDYRRQARAVVHELEGKLAANPTNLQITNGLLVAYGRAGNLAGVRRQYDRLHAMGAAHPAARDSPPVSEHLGGETDLAESLWSAGLRDEARAVLADASPDDEQGWPAIADSTYGDNFPDRDPFLALHRTKEWLALADGREARLQALFDRYRPVVAAALSHEPDVPVARRRSHPSTPATSSGRALP